MRLRGRCGCGERILGTATFRGQGAEAQSAGETEKQPGRKARTKEYDKPRRRCFEEKEMKEAQGQMMD